MVADRRTRRRTFTRALGLLALVTALRPRDAWADPSIEVIAELEQSRVRVGESVRYSIEVARQGVGNVPTPALPVALKQSFEVEGPQTSFSSRTVDVGGRLSMRSSKRFTFFITPLKPGRYELGTHASDKGKKAKSNVPVLEVLGDDAVAEPTEQVGKPTEPHGDIFLWASVDKMEAYVGEQITFSLDIYERSRFLNLHLRTLPTFQDFWTEELPEGQQTRELVGNVPYRVHPGIRRALFPQKAGTLTIGGAQVSVGLRRRISGQPVEIEVLPLPANGQPAGFSPNNVGRYSIRTEVDRTTVKQGEPFTLIVEIGGTGNLRFLDPGDWPEIEGVRRYDPKVETKVEPGDIVSGTRRYQFLVIPEQAGEVTIPVHELAFFDPGAERYLTARSEPIELIVEQGAGGATGGNEDRRPPGQAETEDEEALAEVMMPANLPRHQPREPWLTTRRWVYGMAGVPTVLVVGATMRALWHRLGPDASARDRARARARQRDQIEKARSVLADGEGFHGAIALLLQDLALASAGPRGVGLPRPELMRLLTDRGAPQDDIDRITELLERCDAARFGGQKGTRDERESLLEDTLALARKSSLAKGVQ